MDDDEIVELFLKKDESAIIHTAEKYGCRLRSISQRITADILTAEECENDTYLEAWNRIPPNEPRTYLIAFLSKIIRNISINKCIEKNRLKRRAYIVELSSEMEQCIPAVNDVESYVDGVEIGRVISTFLRKQPKEKRIIFMHKFTGELKSSEEGRVYWIPLEELKTRELATGMEYVLQILESEQVGECYMHLEADGYVGDLY